MSKRTFILAMLSTTTMLTGCGRQQSFFASPQTLSFASTDSPACFTESFRQPEAEISNSIDLLFVMDTSGSMADNLSRVADGLSAFISELPAHVDYRVAVMLAHGSTSSWGGKLFSHNGNRVLSSQSMSATQISNTLRTMVQNVPSDPSGEQGEMGSYSLMKALTTNLALNRSYGFLRTSAALAVVFVSDENDICAPYQGMSSSPGMTSAENGLRSRDCATGIATNTVISKVREVQGDRPYMFGAVVHKDVNYVGGNDSYGWGYIETVTTTGGVSVEIDSSSYAEGLAEMGRMATSRLNLVMDYTLARAGIDAATVRAYVDGSPIGSTYDSAQNEVHLSSGGHALSSVEINYCVNTQ